MHCLSVSMTLHPFKNLIRLPILGLVSCIVKALVCLKLWHSENMQLYFDLKKQQSFSNTCISGGISMRNFKTFRWSLFTVATLVRQS